MTAEQVALLEQARPAPHVDVDGPSVVDTAYTVDGESTAVFSPDRRYRYHLTRRWDDSLPAVTFIMLNPSTADAEQLDPTVNRCVRFARRWGYGTLWVVNVMAWRATKPLELRHVADPVGPSNDAAIAQAARSSALTVAAWGVHAEGHGRHQAVLDLLAGVDVHALHVTKHGAPGHPLYLPRHLEPQLYASQST